jgi:hypothetical protein
MGILRGIADPVRELEEDAVQQVAQRWVGDDLVECAAHAEHPRIAFGWADAKADVAHAQKRMAALAQMERLAAEP